MAVFVQGSDAWPGSHFVGQPEALAGEFAVRCSVKLRVENNRKVLSVDSDQAKVKKCVKIGAEE